jgi:DNA segregation ATPase FtsK/SpoIIIE, S-DNA-T family
MPQQGKNRYAVEEPPGQDWFGWISRIKKSFGRFSWDIGGIILIALSLMLLLALTGLTNGRLLSFFSGQLQMWFGWGSFLFVIATALGGFLLLRRTKEPLSLKWGRVISIEVSVFLLLALFSVIGEPVGNLAGNPLNSLERAEAGMDGGLIGWGLANLFGRFVSPLLSAFIILIGLAIATVFALGLLPKIESWLYRMAGDDMPEWVQSNEEVQATAIGTDVITETESAKPEVVKPTAKKAPPLEKKFRKTFKVSEAPDEKPAVPLPRGERLPPLNLLLGDQSVRPDEKTINQTAGMIEKTLSEFGIPAQVIGFRVGPAVTQFAVQPGFIKKPGSNEDDPQLMKVRVAQIASLQRDLALTLAAERLRIEAPVPGKPYVGIEVPNSRTSVVRLRPILEGEAFNKVGKPLAIALGRDVSGQPVIADLSRMPHLLIAGATGSGKSVCITSIAACLAMNNAPEDLRLVMIDSKMVELIRYNGLPHLLGKVETDINRIMGVLRWVVVEMEHRYRLLEGARARDIEVYNRRAASRKEGSRALPRIVVMIDELADLMMNAPDQTEHNLVRLAQMARATGIHLVVATQRPSTDVVTGLIKANFPARISFAVSSGVDSRVILDSPGAETLLGRGDMLFQNPEVGNPLRAQGVYVTDQEIERIIAFWQKMAVVEKEAPPWEAILSEPEEGEDSLIEQAIEVVKQSQHASASLLQRKLRVGYPRAARLLDQLEELGVVGPSLGGGREREVLVEPGDESNNLDEEEEN